MHMRRWLDGVATVLLWTATAATSAPDDDSNSVAVPRGWSEDEWLLRAQSDAPLCPEGCACSRGRLDCAGAPRSATHLVVRGIPLGDALASPPAAAAAARTDSEGRAQSPLGPAKGLKRLALRDCALNALHPAVLEPLRELREADLSGNSLRALSSDAFASCQKLEKLFLSGNPLGTVPALQRKGLRWLQMDNCTFQEMAEDVFEGTPQVMYLSVRSNSLRALPAAALQPLRELIHLHLEHNAVERLQPNTFTRHRLLQTLYLKGNPIQLPEDEAFLESSSLLILDLRACGLRAVSSKTFSKVPLLRSLLLAQNAIETLPVDAFDKLHHLQILDLGHNKMAALDPLVFRVLRFKAHALLDVSGNPLGCSCLVLKCRETPKRCALKSASLLWRPAAVDASFDPCTEEERAACLAGGAGSGVGDDADFYEQFASDPAPDINAILRPKLDEDSEGQAGLPGGGAILSLDNRSTQVAMGISGAVVFVIVIAVTVYMARRCRKDERLRRASSDDTAEEAALSWTVMDPDTFRTAAVSTVTSDGGEVIRTPQGTSAGGVGDGWRTPRSRTGPSLDEPLEGLFLGPQRTSPVNTGTFRRQHTEDHRPSIQHHRRFDSED